MKKLFSLTIVLLIASISLEAHEFKVLIFSKTAGFRHTSIPNGIAAIQQLGIDNGFTVDATEDATQFTLENLMQYDAVIFLSTTGDVLNADQQSAFESYIRSGKGFVGIHAASDTEYDWPWYGGLVGAYFNSHPDIQTATIKVADKVHPSTNFLPDRWVRNDEWYNFNENPRGEVHVLATLDESTYFGGNMGLDHPIAWLHEYDGGRAWYTAGGHTEGSYAEPEFLNHILGGILYASGDIVGQYEATIDDQYQVTVLDNNPVNAVALTVLPNLDILYVERSGTLKKRSAETGLITVAGTFDVDAGREDGLIGITKDPDFENNNWIYIFYSPVQESEQRISRFEFDGNTINKDSEVIVIEFPVQRAECCHSGGDMEFDSNGNLFIATGDNTNPFQSNGYTPIDERPGREAFDAQRTSGNTQSPLGKILRIHPESDGTYTIPAGNLFTDPAEGLPEIYVMGTRNPYRMAIHEDTDELVWGDVGPDAGGDSPTFGPIGYDEFNRTTVAGNFGWPFCIGDNRAYRDYDYATDIPGDFFNCTNLVNSSPNNTGITNLPPAIPAWISYPYGPSNEFPEFGNQTERTAIAGGFFNYDSTLSETGGFPRYFDGSLFIMEWTRNWIKEVRLDSDGNILKIDDFLPDLQLSRPIDMEFGPDGAMYIVEWGSGFFEFNEDARIIKIEYAGNLSNRVPISIASASVTNGPVPLTVEFTGDQSSDPNPEDALTFSWDFDGDGNEDSNSPNGQFVYNTPGLYLATLTVKDSDSAFSVSQIEIVAGNTAPELTFEFPVNGGFFREGDIIDYKVMATDAEQGSIGNGLNCADVRFEPSIGHDDHSHGVGPREGCEGNFQTESHGDGPDNVFYVLDAELTDDGAGIDAPLTGNVTYILQPKLRQAEHAIEYIDVQAEFTGDYLGGGENIGFVNNNSALMFSPMNFSNIQFITARYASLENSAEIEVRLDSQDGELIGTMHTEASGAWQTYNYFIMDIEPRSTTHDVYFVFKGKNGATNGIGNVNWFEFYGQGISRDNSDAEKGLTATYYRNDDFTGESFTRNEPMIGWGLGNDKSVPGFGEFGSVRWEGQLKTPGNGRYRLVTSPDAAGIEDGSKTVFLDGVEIISEDENTSSSITFNETDEPRDIRVDYIPPANDFHFLLEWATLGLENETVHTDYLIPDQIISTSTDDEIVADIPDQLSLSQNYPNPFNPTTQINFNLPNNGQVALRVYNILGQNVATLVNQRLNAGSHTVSFDASNLSSGLYLYRLEFNGQALNGKMLLLK